MSILERFTRSDADTVPDTDETIAYTFHRNVVGDGESIEIPENGEIVHTHRRTSKLSVWYLVPGEADQ